jgi:hypothetical protein
VSYDPAYVVFPFPLLPAACAGLCVSFPYFNQFCCKVTNKASDYIEYLRFFIPLQQISNK